MIVHEVWQAIERESKTDFGKTRFVPYFFDKSLRSVQGKDSSGALNTIWSTQPTGKATDLGAALLELQKKS